MSAAFLVPRRADHGARDRLWAYTRPLWQERFPSTPIIEGHDDAAGLFNRSRAMNRARALAGHDVGTLVILDADVLVDPGQVAEAIELAEASEQLTIGYTYWCGLTELGTEQVMAGEQSGWSGWVQDRYSHSVSSLVAVPAGLWDEVGGFDERFQGWGLEDSAFELACRTLGGGSNRVEGDLWHLWHPRDSKAHHAERLANRPWFRRYQQALHRPERMRSVCAEALEHRTGTSA